MTQSKKRLVRLVLRLTEFISKRRISGMALLILALLQRIFLMSSLMLLLVWLIFFMVLIKLLPILGRSEERFSRNAETDLVCRLLLEKKKQYICKSNNCTNHGNA